MAPFLFLGAVNKHKGVGTGTTKGGAWGKHSNLFEGYGPASSLRAFSK